MKEREKQGSAVSHLVLRISLAVVFLCGWLVGCLGSSFVLFCSVFWLPGKFLP